MTGPTLDELKERIGQSTAYYGGTLPTEAALVWDGYLAALIEWGLISVSDHAWASDLIPEVPNNPVVQLLLGRDKPPPDATPKG